LDAISLEKTWMFHIFCWWINGRYLTELIFYEFHFFKENIMFREKILLRVFYIFQSDLLTSRFFQRKIILFEIKEFKNRSLIQSNSIDFNFSEH
jgi:hypothetical protein